MTDDLREALARGLHLSSPAALASILTHGEYSRPKHLDLINDLLVETVYGTTRRIIVAAPPRHGKSHLLAVWYPTWRLAHRPQDRIGVICHTYALARDWGLKIRTNLLEYFPEIGVELAEDSTAAHRWQTKEGGGVVCFGIDSAPIGLGFDCLPGDTLVSTERGQIPIEILARTPYPPRVWSKDAAGNLCLRRIRAARKTFGADLVEIQTASGRRATSTATHRYYVPGRGYTRAERLSAGDPLYSLPSAMLVVQNGEQLRASRDQEDAQAEGRVQLLLDILQEQASGVDYESAKALRQVRKAAREDESVLDRHMRTMRREAPGGMASATEARFDVDMYAMRRFVLGEPAVRQVLLSSLRGRDALGSNGGQGELSVQDRRHLRRMVQAYEAGDPRARRPVVRGLRSSQEDRLLSPRSRGKEDARVRTSHRREQEQQRAGELDRALSGVPPTAPLLDSVLVARSVRGGGIPLYDIQVEETQCFFANEILTHNCLILDDVHANAEAAESEVSSDAVFKMYQWVATTRMEPKSTVICSHQRWNDKDLIGRLTAAQQRGPKSEGYDNWKVVTLPSLAEAGDPLGRKEGEALWPARYDEDALEKIRVSMGDYAFSAMHQQRPSPKGGGLFKHSGWNYWTPRQGSERMDWGPVRVDGRSCEVRELPETFDAILQSWDCNYLSTIKAFEQGRDTDPVSGLILGRKSSDYYVLDRAYGRFGLDQTIHAVRSMTAKHPEAQVKLIENTANGPTVIARLKHEVGGFVAVSPRGSKMSRVRQMHEARTADERDTRALTMEATLQGGNFWLPHPANSNHPWVEEFRALVGSFPKAGRDDVDALSQGWAYMARGQHSAFRRAWAEALNTPGPMSTMEAFKQRIQLATEKAIKRGQPQKPEALYFNR